VVERNYCLADQVDPASAIASQRGRDVPEAIRSVERAFNPKRLAFYDNERNSISTVGWAPEASHALFLVRAIANDWMRAWHLQALAEHDGWVIVVAPWSFTGPIFEGQALIEVPVGWPAKIERHVWNALVRAAEQLGAAIDDQEQPAHPENSLKA